MTTTTGEYTDHYYNDGWQTSGLSGTGNCVGIRYVKGGVLIRDTKQDKDPHRPEDTRADVLVLAVPGATWLTFLDQIKAGRRQPKLPGLQAEVMPDYSRRLQGNAGATLTFTEGEWNTFLLSVAWDDPRLLPPSDWMDTIEDLDEELAQIEPWSPTPKTGERIIRALPLPAEAAFAM